MRASLEVTAGTHAACPILVLYLDHCALIESAGVLASIIEAIISEVPEFNILTFPKPASRIAQWDLGGSHGRWTDGDW